MKPTFWFQLERQHKYELPATILPVTVYNVSFSVVKLNSDFYMTFYMNISYGYNNINIKNIFPAAKTPVLSWPIPSSGQALYQTHETLNREERNSLPVTWKQTPPLSLSLSLSLLSLSLSLSSLSLSLSLSLSHTLFLSFRCTTYLMYGLSIMDEHTTVSCVGISFPPDAMHKPSDRHQYGGMLCHFLLET